MIVKFFRTNSRESHYWNAETLNDILLDPRGREKWYSLYEQLDRVCFFLPYQFHSTPPPCLLSGFPVNNSTVYKVGHEKLEKHYFRPQGGPRTTRNLVPRVSLLPANRETLGTRIDHPSPSTRSAPLLLGKKY